MNDLRNIKKKENRRIGESENRRIGESENTIFSIGSVFFDSFKTEAITELEEQVLIQFNFF